MKILELLDLEAKTFLKGILGINDKSKNTRILYYLREMRKTEKKSKKKIFT